MNRANLDRRAAIALLAATAAAPAGLLALTSPSAKDGALQRWIARFRSPADASALGEGYLRLRPQEADMAALVSRLQRDLELPANVADGGLGDLRQRLRRRAQADFAAGAFSRVDGVHLADTEFRICALAALLMRDARG